MFCKNCGNEIKENNRFCDSCGNPVISPETEVINKVTEKNESVISQTTQPDKKIPTETLSESVDIQEKPLIKGEIILDFFENILPVPVCWLASLLINAIVLPYFTDAWIFLTFLPYCVVCLAIAGFVFNIPFQIIYIIYYAVISDKNKILEHTKQFVLSVVLGGLSYFLSSHIAIFTVVAVIVGIVSSIKEQKGL